MAGQAVLVIEDEARVGEDEVRASRLEHGGRVVAAEGAERFIEDLAPACAREVSPENDASTRLELVRPIAQPLYALRERGARNRHVVSAPEHREDVGPVALC